jgi:single-strand DNA-binding protein
MNIVVLTGRITSDPQYKEVSEKFQTLRFTIACKRSFKGADNKYGADFIQCQATNSAAKIINQYFAKGSQIAVTGSIRTGKYDKNGVTVYTTEVAVDKFEFVDQKNSGTASSGAVNLSDENFPISDDDSAQSLPFDL